MNVLDAEYRDAAASASGGKESARLYEGVFPMLPCQGVCADDFRRYFQFGRTVSAVFTLLRFVLQHEVEDGNAGRGVAHWAAFGDAGSEDEGVVQLRFGGFLLLRVQQVFSIFLPSSSGKPRLPRVWSGWSDGAVRRR